MGASAGALMAVGGILAAGGALLEGYQAKQTYDYNAAVARQEAKYAKNRATIEEQQFRRQLEAKIGRQRTIQGMSGATGGSNIAALERTIREGEYDAALIRYGGAVDAWRAESAANLYESSANKALFAGGINAGSTLLTTASKFDWNKFSPLKSTSKKPWTGSYKMKNLSYRGYGF